jgi:hypothetical protein
MQPMGRPMHAFNMPCLFFFPFKFGGGGGIFFSLFPGSQCVSTVPFKFPVGSHLFLNMFAEFPMCSPTCSP